MDFDFFFALKKLIGLWVMPLNFLIVFFAVSILLRKYKPRLSAGINIAACLMLVLFSSSSFASLVIETLESKYQVNHQPPTSACYIHVLGSGNGPYNELALHQLSQTSRSRLLEGLRQMKVAERAKQPCVLVLSGYAKKRNQEPHARVMERAARELGYTGPTLLLEGAKDTIEEARALKNEGVDEVVLVTSALHMHRSVRIFKSQGFLVKPAPADFLASIVREGAIVSAGNLSRITQAWHEYVGLVWLWIRNI